MTERGAIGGWSFEPKQCTVKRHFLREELWVNDADGETVLSTERGVAGGKATFPFEDSDGNPVFHVDSGQIYDITGDFTVVEAGTEEPRLVLTKEFDLGSRHWTIERPDGETLAELDSRRGVFGALNGVTKLVSPFPRTFSITASNGEHIGALEKRIHPRTIYDVHIDRPGAIPRTTLVVGAVAVAVLEGV